MTVTTGPGDARRTVLESGDRMDATEFHRRYLLHPEIKRAELIDGRVYVQGRVSSVGHAQPHLQLVGGVPKTEPQPDVMLRWDADHGGRSSIDGDGYVIGVPELIGEISGRSHSYDLHEKKELYRRIGVQEYLVWQTEDGRIDWWELVHGEYVPLPVDADGFIRSRVFPGLALSPAQLVGP